jgi:hypothetical protein
MCGFWRSSPRIEQHLFMLSLQFGQHTNTLATNLLWPFSVSTEIQKLVEFQMCIYFQINQLLQHWFCFPLIHKFSKLCQYCNNSTQNFLESESLSGSSSIAVLNSFASADWKARIRRQGFYLFNDLSEQNGCCKSAWIVSSEIMMSQSLFVATLRRGSGVHSNLKNQWLL